MWRTYIELPRSIHILCLYEWFAGLAEQSAERVCSSFQRFSL